ncbi:MAG TPA: hypothetical protein VFY29_05075 [Terriglobia bacterium]|nr:hypothetical protein [Terriglobia bacterium]
MVTFKRLLILPGVIVILASAAFAQTGGAITVTGANPESFSLTNTSEGTLSSTIALGSLTPGNTNTLTTGTADVRLRSNKAYKLTAQATALNITGGAAADGGDTIALSDIGFGITSITLTGANVANNGARTDAIGAGFDVTGGWPAAANGLSPTFTASLNEVTSATQVLSGTRISKKGNLATTDNYITVTFGVATLPQFFTPNTGFSSVITLTIASQ